MTETTFFQNYPFQRDDGCPPVSGVMSVAQDGAGESGRFMIELIPIPILIQRCADLSFFALLNARP
jgi:hypothetical protein